MYVIGTAGHIDHGKSTLVKALTGIDPDRLQEEKDRGMTIDLGFAWLTLPSGREVSIVDVPGHERFIRNMLAGVGGIDLALLVIAADEGIMPQTEEHLAILEILKVKRAVVALTKVDLVEPDWLELVKADAAARLARSSIGEVPIVPVSSSTGQGMGQLKTVIDHALDDTPPKPSRGRPRVPIDRVFTISGFGTVVTGTLIDGPIEVGMDLEIQPGGIRARARGIQTHKQKVERAVPGQRVAVNLVGVAVEDVARGQALTTASWLRPTTAFDAHVHLLAGASTLSHNARVSVHSGSAEVMGKVRLLDADVLRPGDDAWVQLQLDAPIAVAKGDLFVMRTPNETIGGGEIVEAHARRHRRNQNAVLSALEVFQHGSPEELVVQAAAGRIGNDLGGLADRTGLPLDQIRSLVATLEAREQLVSLGDRVLTPADLASLRSDLLAVLADYHERYPLRAGMPREELRSRLRLSARDSVALLDRLAGQRAIVLSDSLVRRAEHVVSFGPDLSERVDRFLADLVVSPFSPPALNDLAATHQLDDEVIGALIGQGRIIRVNENIAFGAEPFAEIRRQVVARLQGAATINVAEVRDMLDTSRKYALALMEYFDQSRLTRRVGDARVLR
jgi:selenocysteine-specific elongation factor